MKKVVYIAGYGRSGTTLLARELSKYFVIDNLGEINKLSNKKYYDLISNYYKPFIYENELELNLVKGSDIFGIWDELTLSRYSEMFESILDHTGAIADVLDTSKTTIDAFMRPMNISKFAHIKVILVKVSLIKVLKRSLKGKNSNLERNLKKSKLRTYLHLFVVFIQYYISTRIWKYLFQSRLEVIEVNTETIDKKMVLQVGNSLGLSERSKPLIKERTEWIVYGNRNRLN